MSGVHRDRLKRPSLQRIVQLASAALINGYIVGFGKGKIYTGSGKGVCLPVLNCYSCPGALGSCPIGAMQSALGARHKFPFYVLGVLMLFGIVLGRLVCGMLCPFGFVQDLLAKVLVPKIRVPKAVDKVGRHFKYLVLVIMVIILPAFITEGINPPYFCKYICPAGTLEGGIPLMLADSRLRQVAGALFTWKVALLVVFIVGAVFIHRPFCKYVCPLGAFYALFNRFSLYQLHLDREKCVDCKRCEHHCPMGVEVTRDINSPECIRCGKCKRVCPTGAISSGISRDKCHLKQQTSEKRPLS